MCHARNAISGLVVLCDFGSEGDDCAGEVAPDCGSFRGEDFVVDVFPVEL